MANTPKAPGLAKKAKRLYEGKQALSIDQIADECGVSYRTARKALVLAGVTLRGPSERLVGRTRPDCWA